MTIEHHDHHHEAQGDSAPGDNTTTLLSGLQSYLIGLVLAALLTVASFLAVQSHFIYGPGIPVALAVLAITQMGVHLAFFLHLTSAPDNTNNVLALAFGVLIVTLVVGGTLWIMTHLDNNMIPMDQLMKMTR